MYLDSVMGARVTSEIMSILAVVYIVLSENNCRFGMPSAIFTKRPSVFITQQTTEVNGRFPDAERRQASQVLKIPLALAETNQSIRSFFKNTLKMPNMEGPTF